MSKTPSQRAMADVDRVAEAIANSLLGDGTWNLECGYSVSNYRAAAVAVIDVLGLSEEWTRTLGETYPCGHFATRDRAEARNRELDQMYPEQQTDRGVASRLVSPWVPDLT